MARLTKRGVCYTLKETPYTLTIENGLKFYFSSQFHLDKFKELYAENRLNLSTSLSARFKFKTHCDEIADVTLYRKIENRGFLVEKNGVEYKWHTAVELNGEIKTTKT